MPFFCRKSGCNETKLEYSGFCRKCSLREGITLWKNDNTTHKCTGCQKPFTTFFRKHHCRFCGEIFCDSCSNVKITLHRICNFCLNPSSQDITEMTFFAKDAIRFCNSVILKSRSRIMARLDSIDSPLFPTQESQEKYALDIHKMHRSSRYVATCSEFNDLDTYVSYVAQHSMKYNIGNCMEFAIVAFHYLKEKMMNQKYKKFDLTVASIENGDHVFLIIGRFNTHKSIICDAWAKKQYAWERHSSNLSNFRALNINQGILENFDFKRHKIAPKSVHLKNGKQTAIQYRP